MNGSGVFLALIVTVSFILLSFFPLIMLFVFYRTAYDRVKKSILEDLNRHKAFEMDVVRDRRGNAAQVGEEIETTCRTSNFLLPALLLTFSYGVGFIFMALVLDYEFNDDPIFVKAGKVAQEARPFMVAFLSVYLFNTGAALPAPVRCRSD